LGQSASAAGIAVNVACIRDLLERSYSIEAPGRRGSRVRERQQQRELHLDRHRCWQLEQLRRAKHLSPERDARDSGNALEPLDQPAEFGKVRAELNRERGKQVIGKLESRQIRGPAIGPEGVT
jgi:hypothetical protein